LILFTEESVIEAVDVNGTRVLEKMPDNFDGRFGCVPAKYNCLFIGLLDFLPPIGVTIIYTFTSYAVCGIAC